MLHGDNCRFFSATSSAALSNRRPFKLHSITPHHVDGLKTENWFSGGVDARLLRLLLLLLPSRCQKAIKTGYVDRGRNQNARQEGPSPPIVQNSSLKNRNSIE